ncbi:YbbR-like domain-containing protein [Deinococcus sp.]|uniref:CdaR family protein n=1 Tax=Deinococcus sp. TaxID=47478 RepID=UPI003B5BC803
MSQSELPGQPAARPVRAVRYWWQRFLHNLPQKLLALALASVVWFVATQDRRATVLQTYEVALEVRDTTGGNERRAISNLTPATVRVTLSGSRQRLGAVNASDIAAYVDVTDASNGQFSRTVRVIGPDNARSIKVAPTIARGRIDAEASRTQPVILSITSSPGDSLPRYLLSPRQVTVSGPSQQVDTVDRVVTVPMSLGQGDQREARLMALSAEGVPVDVQLQPASVTVTRIDSGTLPIRSVPVRLSSPPDGLKVTSSNIEPSTVRLIGPADIIAGIGNVTAELNYRAGTFSAQPTFNLPDGVRSLDRVTVQVTAEAQ